MGPEDLAAPHRQQGTVHLDSALSLYLLSLGLINHGHRPCCVCVSSFSSMPLGVLRWVLDYLCPPPGSMLGTWSDALLLTCWVSLGMDLTSVPQFPYLQNVGAVHSWLWELLWELMGALWEGD